MIRCVFATAAGLSRQATQQRHQIGGIFARLLDSSRPLVSRCRGIHAFWPGSAASNARAVACLIDAPNAEFWWHALNAAIVTASSRRERPGSQTSAPCSSFQGGGFSGATMR